MSYTPTNLRLYLAAYDGAIAGMNVSGRFIRDPSVASYVPFVAMAGAWAQSFDIIWADATDPNVSQVQLVQSASEGAWQTRAPQPSVTSLSVATYNTETAALAALVRASDSYLTEQGITPPAAGGGGTLAGDVTGPSDANTLVAITGSAGVLPIAVGAQTFEFAADTVPIIKMVAISVDATVSPPLVLNGQDSTGDGSNAGAIKLFGGNAGANGGAGGDIVAQGGGAGDVSVGGTVYLRGGDVNNPGGTQGGRILLRGGAGPTGGQVTIAQPTLDELPAIIFGLTETADLPSTTGEMRVNKHFTLYHRSDDGTTDIPFLQFAPAGAHNNEGFIIGDNSGNTSEVGSIGSLGLVFTPDFGGTATNPRFLGFNQNDTVADGPGELYVKGQNAASAGGGIYITPGESLDDFDSGLNGGGFGVFYQHAGVYLLDCNPILSVDDPAFAMSEVSIYSGYLSVGIPTSGVAPRNHGPGAIQLGRPDDHAGGELSSGVHVANAAKTDDIVLVDILPTAGSDQVVVGRYSAGTSIYGAALKLPDVTTAAGASAGASGALPALVAGYIVIEIAGVARKMPFYAT